MAGIVVVVVLDNDDVAVDAVVAVVVVAVDVVAIVVELLVVALDNVAVVYFSFSSIHNYLF